MNEDKLSCSSRVADTIDVMPPAHELDHGKYMDDLAAFDLSEAQKRELLETLWTIMRRFVELGWRVNICEQMFENAALDDPGAPDAVKSASAQEDGDER